MAETRASRAIDDRVVDCDAPITGRPELADRYPAFALIPES